MSQHFIPRRVVRLAAGCVLGLACAVLLPSAANQARADDPWKGFTYEDAGACKQCHGFPTKDYDKKGNLDLVLMAEYPIWKTHDKHAQAYAVLEGPRGKRIGKNLFGDEGEKWQRVFKEEAGGCLACHAMNDLSKENLAKGAGKGLDPKDGVSCGGCHGPSSAWRGLHDNQMLWREMTAAQKTEKGLRDLRDPVVRAYLCTSCHVGNASEGKVVTHAMFAAGHPPLPPIDISSFSRNLPQHWRDVKAVPFFQKNAENEKYRTNYHLDGADFQRARFTLVGNVVSLRKQMKLVRDRSDLKSERPATLWPELLSGLSEDDAKNPDKVRALAGPRWPDLALAHSDCYACHHELNYPGYRQGRGYGYQLFGKPAIRTIPGRTLIRQWPLSFIEGNIGLVNQPQRLDDLQALLTDLAKSSTAVPFGRPEQVGRDASKVVVWCDQLLVELNKPAHFTKDSGLRFMLDLCKIYDPKGGSTPDYETARQVASALRVMYEDLRGKDPKDDEIQKLFKKLTDEFDLEPFKLREKRSKILLGIVRKVIKEDSKGLDEFAAFAVNVNDPNALKKLIGEARPNQFLVDLQAGVSNDDFTTALQEKAVVDELQALSDEEERQILDAVAKYNPAAFKEDLKKLAGLLKP